MESLRASSNAPTTSPVQRIRTSAGKNARGAHSIGRARSLARFMILGIIALAGLAFYSGSSAAPFFHYSKNAASALVPNANSNSKSVAPDTALGKGSLNKKGLEGYLLPAAKSSLWPQLVAETIATFAADCTTLKSSFFLGETVCAKTDDVDLGFPGGRWVHWLREDASIAFGGNGITDITTNPQFFSFTPDALGSWKATIAETGDISQTAEVFTVTQAPESIATYEATCNLAEDNFTVGATVCAKADPNFSDTRYIYWVNSQGDAVQTDIITSTNPSATRTMTVAGNWWVYFSDSDGSLRSKHAFTVSDPLEPRVDLSVFKTKGPEDVFAGGFISFVIDVGNRGPDTASTVTLTDAIPANTTFVSSSQDSSGPTFNCTTDSLNTVCDIASLQPGATASFTFVYQVNSGTAVGTEISNSATISSTTEEVHTPDNSATASGSVLSGTPTGDCTLDCPNDIVTTATTSGEGGGANVTFGTAEGFGSCGTITSDPASGTFFPIGTTTVINTSSTGGGGCSFTVTVIDTAAPTIICPANIPVTANSGESQAFVPNPTGSSSNVGSPTATGDQPLEVTGSRDDGEGLTTAYPIGVTEITWIATDPSGRQATCTQSITVIPDQVLTITCPVNVIAPSPNGCDPATVINPGQATSNSPSATITSQRSDNLPLGDPYPVGTTSITWTATSSDGQSASCTQTVTVTGTGTTPPTLAVPPNVSVTTSSCSATLDEELGVATADDSCGSVSISRSGVPTFSCPTSQNPNQQCESFVFPTGTTIITYTATNSAGLSTTGTQTVTVTEDPAVPPTITAPGAVTLYTGAGPTSCSVTVSNLDTTLGTATANDNCPGVSVARSNVPAGNVFPVGTTTVTYTATDASGNTATDTQDVTVEDNTDPVVTPPDAVTANTGLGATSCDTVISDETLDSASATDNCPGVGVVSRTGVPTGNVFPVGSTTVTYMVTDAHGNTSSANQTVTVIDNTPPVISCPENITTGTDSGTCSAIVNPGTATATDNCDSSPTVTGIRSDSQLLNAPYPKGTTTITWTATDHASPTPNQSSCTQTVTVEDDEDPVITVSGQQSMWPPNHKYRTFGVTNFVTGVNDNCDTISVSSVVITKVTSDEIENGNGDGNTLNDIVIAADCKSVQLRSEREGNSNGRVYTIFFSVTDASGNVGTATVKVVVPHNTGQTPVDSGPHYTVFCGGL